MKKMRLVWVGLALLMGVVFVSCQQEQLGSGVSQWEGIVRVNANGSFTDMNGVVLLPKIPTSTSAAMVSIKCEFNSDELASGRVNVTLLGEPADIDGQSRQVDRVGAVNDMVSNTAIHGLAGGVYTPFFFDAQTLVLPLAFYVKNEADGAAMKAEVNRHSFSLLCYTSPIVAGDTELKLYVRHAVQGDVSPERSTPVWMFRAYPLADILQAFKAKSGKDKPSVVRVYFDENPQSDKLGVGFSNEKSVELSYKF